MEQKEFLNAIRACRRRLNLGNLLERLMFALAVGAGAGIVFQAASLVTPLYYVHVYTFLAVLAAAVTAAAAAWAGRCSLEQAALTMDGFGFQERIVTAYELRNEEGALTALQRRDAMEQLAAHRDRIRIPLWPGWKKTAPAVLLLAVMTGLIFVPSPVRERAEQLHRIRQEARGQEDEIEEILEELQELEEAQELGQDILTPEQLETLRKMQESLQSSLEEYRQAASRSALDAAGQKLEYKYQEMGEQLSGMARSIQNAAASPMTAQSMQAMAEKLQQMSGQNGNGSDGNGQNGSGSDGSGQNGSGQNGDGQNGSGQNGDGQNGSGQNGDGQNGGGSNGGGQNGSGSNGGGQNGGGSNGSGSNGNGSNGNGSNGSGQGGGRGTGSMSADRDYVSVPNAIADSGNLTGIAGNHEDSEYFRAQNGLSWEGTHISYEAVIGSYEKNAYEGISAGRYPSGMEDVIKEYFASFH